MRKIEAIIRPDRLTIIKESLSEMGYPGMTVTEVKGHGAQKGITEMWRGRTFKVDLLSKVKIEIVVIDEHVDSITQAIVKEARTGSIGDGKIFVSNIESVTRIRTGETGDKAV
ncbi:MAG: P-II family nitrogen regulator [Candidatus Brocadiales bacterium]